MLHDKHRSVKYSHKHFRILCPWVYVHLMTDLFFLPSIVIKLIRLILNIGHRTENIYGCDLCNYLNWFALLQAPEMSAFWLLTLFIQLPLTLFLLLNEDTVITPIERSVTILFTVFIILEIIIGLLAMHYLFKYEATKFHMQQFTNLEQIDNPYEEREHTYVNPAFENRFD